MSWNDVLDEINEAGSTFDITRRKYLKALSEKTGRNTVAYYSGWLQKPGLPPSSVIIQDNDKNGFMASFKSLDSEKGLDLILHTPGGDIAATESLIEYFRSKFGSDIRAIVPQLAMSGGTLIACSCKTILMGKHSSLGPIDPQINGVPAHGIIDEFEQAAAEIRVDPTKVAVWQPIIAKYNPTLIGECKKAMEWSHEIARESLKNVMFQGDEPEVEVNATIDSIVETLGDHVITKSHSRHLSADKCEEIGLKIEKIEEDQELQNAILSVHHAFIHSLSSTQAVKIIENQDGKAFIQTAN